MRLNLNNLLKTIMGKYKNGINGQFSGKVGNVVGVTRRGVDYIRSVPELRVDKPSEKQIRQRNIMAMISSWLKPIKFIIAIGFKVFTGSKTPINQVFFFDLQRSINCQWQ